MKADIIAFKSYSLLSRMIRWVTGKDITHIAILVDTDLLMETSLFGVRLRKLRETEYEYLQLRYEALTEEQRIDIVDFVLGSVGVGYDFKLLFGIGLNILFGWDLSWDNRDKYICIELILKAYASVGVELLKDINTNHIVPEDILLSEDLTIVL
jgi:uncharacterized protein YycO